jgi:hypothetical protein
MMVSRMRYSSFFPVLAFYFAGAMLGVDDNVIFLKFHPAIVRLGCRKASF